MYFITNNEDYVVAASKSLLDKIGHSDVCSISLALKNREIIVLEDDELKISSLNINFKYSLVELHSAFGKLNLYNLNIKNDSDDSIEYLKKIKEGLVQTQDNEFDIPEIKKDTTKQEISQIEKLEQMILDTQEDESIQESQEEEKTLDVVKIFGNKEDLQESESEEKIELKDYIQEEDKSIETVIDDSNIQENKSTSSKEELLDLVNKQESEVEAVNEKLVEIKEEPKEEKESVKESKSGLSKLTSKLFPWGSKDTSSDIELEDNKTTIKTTDELIEKSEVKDIPTIDKNEEIIVEEIKEPEDIIVEVEKDTFIEEEKQIQDIEKPETKESEVIAKESNLEATTLYKLIEIQVNGIDIKENANKLSIDIDNYKLLLDNYLDEIDNYKDDLLNDNKSTIDMLIDASNLLSLDIITKRLQQQPNEMALNELFIITKLIRQKLNNEEFKSKVDTIKEVAETDFEEVEVYEDTLPSIPQDMIDITSSENLLKSIPSQKVEFNPQKASDELNLPKSLIIEFINDFTKQAKEHLPQLVQGYKNDDIKTLQTTAHMLKGAASNLRLDEIAQTLFKIQKENSISKSGELIKEFVAKLKGLENELEKMESISNED